MAHAQSVAAIAVALLPALACGSRMPTTPTGETTTPAGIWRGTFETTTSTSADGDCGEAPGPFVLRVGSGGAGVLQIDTGILCETPPFAVDVQLSTIDAFTVIAGRSSHLDARLELTEIDDGLHGTFSYTATAEGHVLTKQGTILFAARDQTVTRTVLWKLDWMGDAHAVLWRL